MNKTVIILICLVAIIGSGATIAYVTLQKNGTNIYYQNARSLIGKNSSEIQTKFTSTPIELTQADLEDWKSKNHITPSPPIVPADQILVFTQEDDMVIFYIKSQKVFKVHEAKN